MSSKGVDISGIKYGKLIAIEPTEFRQSKGVVWRCICSCGNKHLASAHNLRQGKSPMCKQCRYHDLSKKRTSHGKSRTQLYRTWISMIDRCSEHGDKKHNYFDRGIKVWEGWLGHDGLDQFIKDVGERPSKDHSLDRINNDGDYTPSNVRWATRSQQMKNRRKMSSIQKFSDKDLISEMKRRGLL